MGACSVEGSVEADWGASRVEEEDEEEESEDEDEEGARDDEKDREDLRGKEEDVEGVYLSFTRNIVRLDIFCWHVGEQNR